MIYDRDLLVAVLIHHSLALGVPQGYTFSCACGWGSRPEHLGLSFAEHIADVYEMATAELL